MINLNDENRKAIAREYGRVVNTVSLYTLGVSADIFLNKDGMIFSAHLNGDRLESKDGNAVNRWLAEQLEAACKLEWIPVICVLDPEPGDYNYSGRKLELHQVCIDVNRFYVAVLPDKKLRAVLWETLPEKRLTAHADVYHWPGKGIDEAPMEGGKLKLPIHDETSHVLAYSENLWAGLNELMHGIDRLRGNINELLKSDEGVLKLESVGTQMLKLLN